MTMRCPHCDADLQGELIYQTFFLRYSMEQRQDPHKEALLTAALYGATETEGHWGKQIGIYNMEKDRTTHYQCPECHGTWTVDYNSESILK